MLHPTHRAVIEATAGVVAENAVTITKCFYPKMFDNHPELQNVFNQANQDIGEQPVALASSIVAYARHLLGADDVPFERVIERIAHKHVALGIAPHDYTIVGRNLMEAIGEVLGDAVTPEVAAAWGEVYWLFAVDLVAAEAKIYSELGVTPETLLRKHRIISNTATTSDTNVIRFQPCDGAPCTPHIAGQYVSVIAELGRGRRQPRQYTISSGNHPDWFEITVRRARAVDSLGPDGVVSHLLNDAAVGSEWQVSAPCGDIHVSTGSSDLTLISAGVGVTPMASILAQAAQDSSTRRITHVHFDATAEQMPLADETAAAVQTLENGSQQLVFGETDVTALRDITLTGSMEFYLCGSVPFMRDARAILIERGVESDAIWYEVFGPDLWLGGSVASQAQLI